MKKRFLAIILALVMCLGLAVPALAADAGTGNTILSIPWDKINRCGHQSRSGPCMSYCWAYCRIILENRDHTYTQYHVNGVGGVSADTAGYTSWKNAANESALLKALYDNINLGYPVVVQVNSYQSGYHYVVAVGYKNSCDPNNLKRSDILILDPANSAIASSAGSTETYKDLGSRTFSSYLCYTIPKSGGVAVLGRNIVADGTYTLAPACAPNARLDVAGGSQENGANVQIYTDNGSAAQQWIINAIGNGYYTLTSKGSGKVLDTYYSYSSSGQNVMQFASCGYYSEQWKFKNAGDGYYYLIPRSNETLCLDVSEGSSQSGTNVQIYDANQSNAQKWKLTRVDQPAAQTPAQPSKPTNLTLSTNKSSYTLGETVTITPSANNITHYAMSIWLGAFSTGTRVYAQNTIYGAVAFKPTKAGTYTIRVDAKNNAGYISTEKTFTVAANSQPTQHQHQKGTYLWYQADHPHYNYYTCSICGARFTDGSTSNMESCKTCNPDPEKTEDKGHWGDWSDWSKTPVTATSTRQVETRQVKVSDAYREYRYVGYYCYDSRGKLHDCWCATYLKKLYGSATLRYSDWSTTRYSPNGKAWTCGSCNGNHIGVAEYSNGKPYWAEYILPGGNSYYWEESRTVEAKYETQYHYRDWISG